MMCKHVLLGLSICVLSSSLALQAPAQQREEGVGESIGERIDRGLTRLRSELSEEWAEIRQTVERLGVQGRVYSRLRWDKDLHDSQIDIEVAREKVVVLQGQVRSDAAKRKAVQLTQDTVGVEQVVDELSVAASQ